MPWGHIRPLLDKTKTSPERDWYAAAGVEHGWSRNVLMNMIMSQTMERTGSAPSNFADLLPAPGSELAQQAAKDRTTLNSSACPVKSLNGIWSNG
ncbi:DUF1016 N-terminal domain-containing protein [Arthrobacter sulfonylureivorans]|uniref:DUF1016 N-terminal domain-containing protein n=1 Tax=Arthrobacter sulfonylureivorans TaxID=2486855 RepID=UPI0030CAE332